MVKQAETAYSRDETPTDTHLVTQARRGDVDAFGCLYRRHAARIHSLCLRLTGDPATAADLVQDAFVLAWGKLGDYRGESQFGSWMHRIAVNAFLGMVRARTRRNAWMDALRALVGAREARPAVDPGVRMDLDTAISKLPPNMRAVFVLHDVEGYRHEEAAAMLGISPGTCKAQLHHARRRLREELEQ